MLQVFKCVDLDRCQQSFVEVETYSPMRAAEIFALSKWAAGDPSVVKVRVWRSTDEQIVDVFVEIALIPKTAINRIELVSSGKTL